jgi:hypothetical protein
MVIVIVTLALARRIVFPLYWLLVNLSLAFSRSDKDSIE